MKKSFYLFLILALPGFAIAQTTPKKTTTTKTTTTVKKTTAAKKPVAGNAKPQPATAAPKPRHINFQTFVNNDVMMVNADFQIGNDYVVTIANDKKETLFTAAFNAQSMAQNINLGKPLGKGTFHITVQEKNNPLATGTITLVMN